MYTWHRLIDRLDNLNSPTIWLKTHFFFLKILIEKKWESNLGSLPTFHQTQMSMVQSLEHFIKQKCFTARPNRLTESLFLLSATIGVGAYQEQKHKLTNPLAGSQVLHWTEASNSSEQYACLCFIETTIVATWSHLANFPIEKGLVLIHVCSKNTHTMQPK